MKTQLKLVITLSSIIVTSPTLLYASIKPRSSSIAKESRCACICGSSCENFTCPTVDIATSARVVALKALNRMPIDPNKDFPPNIASFTDAQREEYRQEFAKNIACVFGCPAGWKLALGTATPATPALGYTEPSIGQLFTKMTICAETARITNNFAVATAHEVDLVIRVSNEAINQATTPDEIVENIDAVFPYYELPALYVQTLAELAGPTPPFSGNSLLTPLNGAARLGVLGTAIAVPGNRTIAQWVETLTRVTGTETIRTTTGTTTRPFNNANYLNFALTLIRLLKSKGIVVKKGDILSLGNSTGVNLFRPDERELSATYTNIDPDGPVTMTLIVDNENGLCIGDSSGCTGTVPSSNPLTAFITKKYCNGCNA